MEQFRLEMISGGHTAHTKQGWWQRVWFASGVPGSTAYKGGTSLLQVTVARLLGKCSLSKNVGYFFFSFFLLAFGVFHCRTWFDFWIATSRDYLAFSGLPFSCDSSTALHGSPPLLHRGLSCWYYFQAKQRYRAGFFLQFTHGLLT